MQLENVAVAIEREPFVPLRPHFVSGKTLDIRSQGAAWMLTTSLLDLQDRRGRRAAEGAYDMIDLRNVERIEQLPMG